MAYFAITQILQYSGLGTFVTQYTYNSADLPLSMRYPADASGNLGETVAFT